MTENIIINYDEMKSISALFETEKEQILHLLQITQTKVQDLHNDLWIGKGSDKFFDQMEQTVKPRLARLAHALDFAAVVTKEIADTIHQADEETQSFFRNLWI